MEIETEIVEVLGGTVTVDLIEIEVDFREMIRGLIVMTGPVHEGTMIAVIGIRTVTMIGTGEIIGGVTEAIGIGAMVGIEVMAIVTEVLEREIEAMAIVDMEIGIVDLEVEGEMTDMMTVMAAEVCFQIQIYS
jgi:hypothetical protein